ncbi:MAG TPA: hypothetical protein VGM88_20775 [Kofleriaceae bacterium]|jgi:hypothetical protein
MMRKLSYLVVVLAAACGDDGNNKLADAPHHDGAIDTPTIDTPPDKVTVTVTQNGAPRGNVHVYFTNADQSPSDVQDTDGTGNATATVGAGGYVTAIDPFLAEAGGGGAHYNLYTIAGVKPGDHLYFSESGGEQTQSQTLTVTVPYRANATHYEVDSICGSGDIYPVTSGSGSGSSTGPVTGMVTVYGCPATTDLLVVALDDDEQPVASFLSAGATITDGASYDLSAATYTDAVTPTYTYNNLDASGLSLNREITSASGGLASYSGSAQTSANTAVVQLASPVVPTGGAGVTQVYYASLSNMTGQGIIAWGPSNNDQTFDAGALELTGFTSQPEFDGTTNKVTWSTSTGGQDALAMETELGAFRGSDSWNWVVYSPYTAGTVQFPTLPTDVYSFNPAADDEDDVDLVDLVNVDGISYDLVRGHVADNSYLIYSALPTGQGEDAYYQGEETTTRTRAKHHQRSHALFGHANPRMATHRISR